MGRFTMAGGGPVVIEDVGGGFQRLYTQAPKVMRDLLQGVVAKRAFAVGQRMKATAPVGPDSPHIRDAVTVKARGLSAQVGYIDATQPAGPDNDATIAEVALYNEYNPNKQSFMKPAADAEAGNFAKDATAAIRDMERAMTGGGLL